MISLHPKDPFCRTYYTWVNVNGNLFCMNLILLTHSNWVLCLRFFTLSCREVHLRGCWENMGNAASCPDVYVSVMDSQCVVKKIWTGTRRKRPILVKFINFGKKVCRFAVAWEPGAIHAQTWQKQCTKWSYFRSRSVAKVQQFFPGTFRAWVALENWVGRRFDPHIPLDSFLGSLGHQNSSLTATCLLLQYGLN